MTRSPTEIRLRNVLTDIAQILDVVKLEWSAENAWSDWDQRVRDELTEIIWRIDRGECSFSTSERAK